MLKTGVSVVPAIKMAGESFDEDSLLRAEVNLMIERMKLGVTEDSAIGSFGEDIPHPEIELFVQSVIISKKVGGKLSDILERLAKQVRKRQQFKKQANNAIGMEKGSLKAIAAIMFGVILYLGYSAPNLVLPALTDDTGKNIFWGGFLIVVLGFLWSRTVSNIKV